MNQAGIVVVVRSEPVTGNVCFVRVLCLFLKQERQIQKKNKKLSWQQCKTTKSKQNGGDKFIIVLLVSPLKPPSFRRLAVENIVSIFKLFPW